MKNHTFFSKVVSALKTSDNRSVQISLEEHYRTHRKTKFLLKEHVDTYALTRFPATYHVLCRILRALDLKSIKSVLDIGCGPLTGLIALLDSEVSCFHYEGIDIHDDMMALAFYIKNVLESDSFFSHKKTPIVLQKEDVLSRVRKIGYDLVVASYVMGELSYDESYLFWNRLFQATSRFGIIVLPGTPLDFSILLKVRDFILESGAVLLAPCGSMYACPLRDQPNKWCHFATHVPRSQSHKRLKGGTLGFEYEKFMYLVFSKNKEDFFPQKRLLSMPLHKKGHSIIEVCDRDGYSEQIISKKQKDLYRSIRKSQWGDSFT